MTPRPSPELRQSGWLVMPIDSVLGFSPHSAQHNINICDSNVQQASGTKNTSVLNTDQYGDVANIAGNTAGELREVHDSISQFDGDDFKPSLEELDTISLFQDIPADSSPCNTTVTFSNCELLIRLAIPLPWFRSQAVEPKATAQTHWLVD